MDDSAEAEEKALAADLIESNFRHNVEIGAVEIGDRSVSEIISGYVQDLRQVIDASKAQGQIPDYRLVINYLEDLLDKASAEEEAGREELAATFYAIWLEHFFNKALATALQRQGYDSEHISPLLRDLRIHTKASSLWVIAGLQPIGKEDLKLIDSITGHRNSFIHYKWTQHGDDDRLKLVVEQADALIERLLALESSAIWLGRESEIIEALREMTRS